ncbi:MAG: hypothetical protein HC889_13900 [Synechococcaceae cyanobacterium SM1_2_3]|nr:hypothetical protein [Synechococcaceae cyanobacterium SM1_2_3]
MHAAKIPYYSVDRYLEMELESEQRHEYVNGEILANDRGPARRITSSRVTWLAPCIHICAVRPAGRT